MLETIFRAIQATGESPSVNAVIACVRRHKHAFRDSDAKRVLRKIGPGPGLSPAPLNAHAGPDAAPTGPRLRAGARADHNGIVNMASDSSSNEPPSLAPDASSAKKRATTNGSRAPKFPLVDAREERSREILALFWSRVHLAVGATLTQAEWRKRNKRHALNLAAVGRSDADLHEAHERASRRVGSCVYSLRIVADELLRIDNPVTANERGGPYDRPPVNIAPEDRR